MSLGADRRSPVTSARVTSSRSSSHQLSRVSVSSRVLSSLARNYGRGVVTGAMGNTSGSNEVQVTVTHLNRPSDDESAVAQSHVAVEYAKCEDLYAGLEQFGGVLRDGHDDWRTEGTRAAAANKFRVKVGDGVGNGIQRTWRPQIILAVEWGFAVNAINVAVISPRRVVAAVSLTQAQDMA